MQIKSKYFSVLMVVSLLLIQSHSYSQDDHKKIVENVDVNWWQVPVFALDSSGNPVLDLTAEDIEVRVNGKRIDGFAFYKRSFSITELKKTTDQPAVTVNGTASPQLKQNAIFLLFDLVLSAESCGRRSKQVAKKIIERTAPGTRFVILTIEPFKGLNHVFGPANDKKELLEKLETNVRPKWNSRTIEVGKFFGPAGKNLESGKNSGDSSRLQDKFQQGGPEIQLIKSQAAAYYMRRSTSFFSSFQSLYLMFNTLNDNKFVYFFTEGLSNNLRESIMGGQTMFNKFIRKVAAQLSRSGAVLFIVNPMGVVNDSAVSKTRKAAMTSAEAGPTSQYDTVNDISGEDSLRYLAKESGGKYVEGSNRQVVETLENMHRAYYEISFPDIAGLKGNTRNIIIKPKRSGLTVHTLRSLERAKKYAKMGKLEQELVAINLVSQNPMLRKQMPIEHARVTKMKAGSQAVTYTVKLPKAFVKRKLDFFKIWVHGSDASEQTVSHLEKDSLTPSKQKITLQIQKNKKHKNTVPYFVLVDPEAPRALVRVIGDRWLASQEEMNKTDAVKTEKKDPMSRETLDRILAGAAIYCEQLKARALHYMCSEEIVETRQPLVNYNGIKSGVKRQSWSQVTNPPGSNTRVSGSTGTNSPTVTRVKKYRFSYRLLKNANGIAEERQWLTPQKDRPLNVNKEQVVKNTAFFSERAVFAPGTLLAAENQERYRFSFLGYEEQNGRRCAVIEGIPKTEGTTGGFYGKAWIDLEDHSVLKVQAHPQSINGYIRLKEFAKKLSTRLQLSLVINFNKLHNGLRFPTRVNLKEYYKGGRTISMYRGRKGWKRNNTIFNYFDYRFFDVKTEVLVETGN